MKKALLTSSLAVAIGATGVASSTHVADAAEQNVNKEQLAQLAQSNAPELNQHGIQEGAYDINFTLNGYEYNFQSDGSNFTWEYHATNAADSASTQEAPAAKQPVAEQNVPAQTPAPVANNTAKEQVAQQAPVQKQEATQQAPAQQQAPVQQAAPKQETQQVKTTQTSTASTGGSTKAQFLAAGGTEAMWNQIVLPESSGNPNAVNELGYQGLGQTKESWGTGSVETQTKGMLNYAKERYGSVDAALAFRSQNNWW